MENASKALIMAAGVLLAIMIMSIGVFLFNLHSEYSAEMYKKMEDSQINQFNVQFTKYYGNSTNNEGKTEPILCTAHDIITVASLAQQNNKEYEVDNLNGYNTSTYYVQVDVKVNKLNKYKLEKWKDSEKINFIKRYSTYVKNDEEQIKYYKCTSVKISDETKRVCYIKFEEI